MANPKVRRIYAGIGWLMVAVCTTAIGLKYGSGVWGAHNGPLLNWAIVGSIAIAVAMAVVYFMTNDSNPPEISIKDANLVGGNNNGRMIAHVDHYHEAKPESLPIPPRQGPQLPSPLPDMKFRADWIHAVYGGGEWTEADSKNFDRKLAVALFENPSASSKGHPGTPLKYIEAHLKFRASREEFTVNTAYWMDSECNRMDIPPAHVRRVILGYFSADSIFTCHENEWSYEIHSPFPTKRGLGRATNISSTEVIEIEITLIEAVAPHRTVEKAIAEINVKEKTIRVVTT